MTDQELRDKLASKWWVRGDVHADISFKAGWDAARASESKCDFCQNTGKHLCPDVAEPVLVSCSKKGCVYGERDAARAEVERLKSIVSGKTFDDENLRLKQALAVAKEGLRDIADQPEFAQSYANETLAEIEKLEGKP